MTAVHNLGPAPRPVPRRRWEATRDRSRWLRPSVVLLVDAALLLVVALLRITLLVVIALLLVEGALLLLVVALLLVEVLLTETALATLLGVVTALLLRVVAAAEGWLLAGVVLAGLVAVETRLLLSVEVLLVAAIPQLLSVDPEIAEQPRILLRIYLAHPLQLLRRLLMVASQLPNQIHDLMHIETHGSPLFPSLVPERVPNHLKP